MSPQNKQVLKFGAIVVILGVFLHFDAGWQAGRVEDDVVRSCERDNATLKEINTRGVVLRKFLNDAARIRERTAAVQREQNQQREAELNEEAADQWRKWAAVVRSVPIPDCDRVVRQAGLVGSESSLNPSSIVLP